MAKKRTIGKDILLRVRWLYVIFLAVGMAIVGRIAWIQYGPDGDQLRERAREVTFARFKIPAERGDILGRDGRILSTTIPEYEIRMDFSVLPMDRDSFPKVADTLARCLAGFFGDKTQSEYKSLLQQHFDNKEKSKYVRLNRRKVSYTEEKQIAQFPLFNAGRYRSGYIAEQSSRRFMPMNPLARSVIGTVRDDKPLGGLEMSCDSLLRGTDGYTMKQRISGQFWMPVPSDDNSEPVNGLDIVTTINADIQDVAERTLRQQVEEYEAYWGTVILMDVPTGEIIAMSNLQRMEDGTYADVFNYGIRRPVEPGSTFKLATLLALLEEGGMTIYDKVDCRPDPGRGLSAWVGRKDVRDDHRCEIQTLKETFEQSSNIGFARSAFKCFGNEPERFVDFIRDSLCLAGKTGIDLPLERSSVIKHPVRDKERWDATSLQMMAYGYALEITPLQTLTLYNAVANNGRMMRPMLIKEVRSYGETIRRYEPQAIKEQLASPATIRAAQQCLAGVVESGTGRRSMAGAAYTAVAKTGTSQQVLEGRGGYRWPDGTLDILASFTGYFPLENPRYSCIVAIKVHEKRGKRYYGSNVAAPVFRAVADRIYASTIELHDKSYGPVRKYVAEEQIKGGRTDQVELVAQNMSLPYRFDDGGTGWWQYAPADTVRHLAAQSIPPADTVRRAASTHAGVDGEQQEPEGVEVPSVVGMGLKDAIYLLENSGFRVTFTGTGRVAAQSVAPHATAAPGQTIQLTLKL